MHFSYEACGFLNPKKPIHDLLSHRTLRVVVLSDPPWVFPAPSDSEKKSLAGYQGPLINFWLEMLENFDTVDTAAFNASSITKTALSLHQPSSFTAAVHDVATGALDVALSSFWIMESRLAMTEFLPTMGTDDFYLVVKKEKKRESLRDILARPFLPFTRRLWGLITLALCIIALVLVLSAGEEEDFSGTAFGPRLAKAIYLCFSGFFGGPGTEPLSVPMRIAGFGFYFLVLIGERSTCYLKPGYDNSARVTFRLCLGT